MRKLIAIALFLVSGFCFANGNSYLFLQTAAKADLVQNKDQTYTLTLSDFPKYVVYFTNRPQRETGMISLTNFAGFWKSKDVKNNFAENPPNVAVAMIHGPSRKQENFIAELSNPEFGPNTVSYQIKLIGQKSIHTGKIIHLNIFFDDITWNPGGFG